MVHHIKALGKFRDRVNRQSDRLLRHKVHFRLCESVADGGLILHSDFPFTLDDAVVLVIRPEQVVQLCLAVELSSALLSHQEQSRLSHRLRWWQELAFFFDVLSFRNTRGGRFFVVDSFHHLIEVERH